jgi:Cytochrome b5-like Heme/Steroid binding domain
MAPPVFLSLEEVSSHNTPTDARMVLNGKVYDMTEFMPEHPGGVECKLSFHRNSERQATLTIRKMQQSSDMPEKMQQKLTMKSTHRQLLKPSYELR